MIAAQPGSIWFAAAAGRGIDDVRIGLNITHVTTPDRIATDVAAVAERLDSVWTNEHSVGWHGLGLLAASGRAPAGLELGTAVVPTYPRHPIVAATEAATVQAATGAPLALGLGPSHESIMSGQLGLDYASPAAHTREYVEIVRGLLRGEHVRHRGRFYTVDTELVVPLGPPPSLLISALGPRMLAVAREVADGTIALWARPAFVADYLVPALGDGARVVAGVLAAVTNDPDGVRDQVARDFRTAGDLPAYRAILDRGGLSGPADTVVAGDEEQVLRELREFADAGATDVLLVPLGPEPERLLTVVQEVRAGTAG